MTEETPEIQAAAEAPKADPAMFSDCGDTPCPQPVLADPKNEAAALAEGVRMRDNPAEWAFVRLSKLIEEFEANLDKDEEIGARVVGLPGDGTMQIVDVGFWGPDLIMFFGRNADGKPVRLIQHYSQINVVLSAVKKPEEREARRIGFQLNEMVQKTSPKPAGA
ncbi:DUF6173 family protein [Brevundimonas naejangsanensis]|uniref:DUF6173 family protein n=1 Tax=Brevundimonas naejangsanensis TaxID=588932 RepID=UPI00041507E2|nr:DUF6173 family protein [Brevundimonas naejangsanensis]